MSVRFTRVSSFNIRFKRNSQFKQADFIGKNEDKIRTFGGVGYVTGYSRARRRQAVRKVSKDLRGIIRFRVSRAQSKYCFKTELCHQVKRPCERKTEQ